MLERERARTDRSGNEFSIILFNIVNSDKQHLNIKALGYLIRKRIRVYDDIGWFEKNKLGILLPETGFDQARKLAQQIGRDIIPRSYDSDYVVLTYPTHWDSNSLNKDRTAGDAARQNEPGSGAAEPKDAATLINQLQTPQDYMPFWKRVMDIVGSAAGLILLLPVLAGVGLFIRIVSPGPILFKQKRVGFMGRTFNCYKFRTMCVNAPAALHNNYFSSLMCSEVPMEKLDTQDVRIIPFGKMLRTSGLDELPQLFNVLKGDMSLIGPRPCIPYEAQEYKLWQRKRFEAVPGITGLWQVNGKNRTTFNEMMRYDVNYTLKKNFLLDIMILLKTIPAVIDQIIEHKSIRRGRARNGKLA
jgi:lipopolysaccharide/colanic/teichoic acid biosynthesis glycosyltransferase